MDLDEPGSEHELLVAAANLLDKLRFTPDMPRESKWRTTEQLAQEMELSAQDATRLDQILRDHEARSLDNLANGLAPDALIRRAKYPDRTTTLPVSGSVKHHGPPWA